jgi:ABC-type transport system substrate-binding protein
MRLHPIGTGPFKFVELKQNEVLKIAKNPDYWKKGLPYLDGIEFPIISNRSTAMLAFVASKIDMTFPTEVTPPLRKDIMSQAPQAMCDMEQTNVGTNMIVNRDSPPFDNPDVRHRPQGLYRHHLPGIGGRRRLAAAAARRRVGAAAGDAADDSGLRLGRAEEPR